MRSNAFPINRLLLITICLLALSASNAFSQQREFHSLEEALLTPDSVEVLILKKQHLTAIPSEIYTLKRLKKLSLSKNNITQISDSISLLSHLHHLDLSSNRISTLPAAMSSLPLDTLILWDNPLYVMDTALAALPLRYLDLRAITMTSAEQKAILSLFPKARIRRNQPCNCGR
ncbi:MAG: hypothetical protein LBL74_01085 [Bacteroidales bacterium]|jgi:Leucine-rich repeat (LRR) protein|nr:hypothetical protein [Bacteroidales bacterium]